MFDIFSFINKEVLVRQGLRNIVRITTLITCEKCEQEKQKNKCIIF